MSLFQKGRDGSRRNPNIIGDKICIFIVLAVFNIYLFKCCNICNWDIDYWQPDTIVAGHCVVCQTSLGSGCYRVLCPAVLSASASRVTLLSLFPLPDSPNILHSIFYFPALGAGRGSPGKTLKLLSVPDQPRPRIELLQESPPVAGNYYSKRLNRPIPSVSTVSIRWKKMQHFDHPITYLH